MEKAFVYGMAVSGENFTDREAETRRLILDFEHGINVMLISPRRMGKTSLVKRAMEQMNRPDIRLVYMDIYDCRSEYDFYNRYASAILKATGNRMEQVLENIKRFMVRVTPKVSFSPEPMSEFSLSLGITPKEYSAEEVLNLPERIAEAQGVRVVVCIDEFQQVGEFPGSLDVQKRLRGCWQHHKHVSYCLFGSKKHLLENLFQSKRMPFYQFGEMLHLECIPTDYWVSYICSRFARYGRSISDDFARRICETVGGHSSYVQQLAWNVMAESGPAVSEDSFAAGVETLLQQCNAFFTQQTENLSSYQMNFLRAVCSGIHQGFSTKEVAEQFPMGTKSNIDRIKRALQERELIDIRRDGVYIADTVFQLWFNRLQL